MLEYFLTSRRVEISQLEFRELQRHALKTLSPLQTLCEKEYKYSFGSFVNLSKLLIKQWHCQ